MRHLICKFKRKFQQDGGHPEIVAVEPVANLSDGSNLTKLSQNNTKLVDSMTINAAVNLHLDNKIREGDMILTKFVLLFPFL